VLYIVLSVCLVGLSFLCNHIANTSKTILIAKISHLHAAQFLFAAGMNIQITSQGQIHLGAAFETHEFAEESSAHKISKRFHSQSVKAGG